MQRPFPAYHGSEPYIFVSYAHSDSVRVYPEIGWLDQQNLNIWYDEGINAGSVWRDDLADRLEHAKEVLFFATNNSISSRNCLNELHFAMDLNKEILVVQFDELEMPPGLKFGLGSRQAIIASHYSNHNFRENLEAALLKKIDLHQWEQHTTVLERSTSLLICDFMNNTNDPTFTDTVEGILINNLKIAGNPIVFEKDRAMAIAVGVLDDRHIDTLDLSSARLVAFREGISFVLSGEISETSGYIQINFDVFDVYNPSNSVDDFTYRDTLKTEDKNEIPGLILRCTQNILENLNVDFSRKALKDEEAITTESLDAAYHYIQGQKAQISWKFDEAIFHYKAATTNDTDFGRAYSGLAASYANTGDSFNADKNYKLAIMNIDRMSERERYRTRGGYFLFIRNIEKAIEEYSQLRNEYPDDEAGWTNIALAHFYNRDMDKAIEESNLGIDHNPGNSLLSINRALYYMYNSQLKESNKQSLELLKDFSHVTELTLCSAMFSIQSNDFEAAHSIYESMYDNSDTENVIAVIGGVDLDIFCGNLGAAEKQLDGLKSGHNYISLIQSEIFVLRQNYNEAIQLLSKLELNNSNEIFQTGIIYADCGAYKEAESCANELGSSLQKDQYIHGKLLKAYVGYLQKDYQAAFHLLEESKSVLDTWFGRFTLGKVFLSTGSHIEAHTEFETCQKRIGEVTCMYLDEHPTMRYLVPLFYFMGMTQKGLGSQSATQTLTHFLDLWGTRDLEKHKAVIEARELVQD